MSFFSELDKHERNPGNYWGSYSSPSSQNQSSDGSEHNPENDEVRLISPRARLLRTCRQKYSSSNEKCIEIEDEPVTSKKAPRSSTDKAPKDFHVKDNDFIIPKLKGADTNWLTCNSKNKGRRLSNQEHLPEDSSPEMSNKIAKYMYNKVVPKLKPLNRSWNHTSSPVRSSPRIASSREFSESIREEAEHNDLQVSNCDLRTSTRLANGCNKTRMASKISKDDIFCCLCDGPKNSSRCLKCENKTEQPKQQSVTVDSFYGSKYIITYPAKRPSRKKIPSTVVTNKKSLSTEPSHNQSKIESSENRQIAINKTGKKRKKSQTIKEPELVHISSDEDDKNEQMESDSAAPFEEDETKEEQGSSGSAFEDQVMDEPAQEHRDNGEIQTASEEECPIPKKDKDTSLVPDTKKAKEAKRKVRRNSTKENELNDSYQRDSLETLLHVQHIYVGKLQGEPTRPVKVTAERIYISLVNGKSEYNFKMEGRDLSSFMINNKSEPLMVIIEPTSGWARKMNEKYVQPKNFIDPGSAVYEEKQIVLILSKKVEPPNLADLIELVQERLNDNITVKIMTPQSAKAELERLPPLDINHSKPDPSSSVEKPTQSRVLSASVLPRKLYNTRSKDISSIRDPKTPPEKLLVYPPSCKHGAITITTEDIECLEPGIYLNDVIIDFFMKYLFEELLSVSDREKTHIFSSFFYKRLTQKNRLGADKKSRTPEYMHSLVKTWTKSVDIFSKDFLIFPINESSHWYLTVICYPGLVAGLQLDENSENDKEHPEDLLSLKMLQESYNSQDSRDNKTEGNSKMSVDDDDDDDFLTNKKYKQIKTKRKKSAEKVPLKLWPCILLFDSLGGCHRSTVLINLRNYLSCEWKERKGSDKPLTFDKLNLKGCYPKVPNQNNFSDCGVYVLQYAQSFFQNPIKDYSPPINIPDWFPLEVVEKKREFVKDLIYKLKDRIDIEDTV